MYRHFFSILAIVLLPDASMAATTFEIDGTLEREQFEYIQTLDSKVTAADTTGDIMVFDKQKRNQEPPYLADLTSVTFQPLADAWRATFTIADALPKDPDLAVNFDVFIDADGLSQNNATSGVYRVGSDTIFMILHGTRTKWHSKWWKYDPSTGRWSEQGEKPVFTIGSNVFTLDIPYTAVPKKEGIVMRGFSLTSTQGITAIDVAPGTNLPAIQSRNTSSSETVISQTVEKVRQKNKDEYPILISLFVLFIGSFLMWWKTK